MKKYILVMTTVPDDSTAQKMASVLLEKRLAACVTISSPCQSLYWWQEKISKDKEHILFIKTQASLYSSLQDKILEVHPYEVPEIIALPLFKGYAKYLSWVSEETGAKRT